MLIFRSRTYSPQFRAVGFTYACDRQAGAYFVGVSVWKWAFEVGTPF